MRETDREVEGKKKPPGEQEAEKNPEKSFSMSLCWGREPIFSKKTCCITGSSHFYLRWSDIQHLWGLSLCKTFWIVLRQASLWVPGRWPLFFLFPSGSLFSWALLMHEYEQPWKAFCLCHKKRSAFDFGHPGFSSKRAIHLDNMFHLFRVRKGTVIRDAGFRHVRSLLESCSAAHHLGDHGGAASASLSLKFPYLPSGAFYSGNKLVKACWEDSASYVKRGGGSGLVTKSCPTLVTPWTVAHQAPLSRDFPGKDTGVGCHFLFQGILLTQGSNLSLLYCRQILYCWATWEAPGKRTVNTWESSPGFMRSFIAKGLTMPGKALLAPIDRGKGLIYVRVPRPSDCLPFTPLPLVGLAYILCSPFPRHDSELFLLTASLLNGRQ